MVKINQIIMKKIALSIATSLFLFSTPAKAIKVKFTVANMSTNIAEGSMGIFTSFEVYPSDYNNPDSLALIDFSTIAYSEIKDVVLEKMGLSEQSKTSFSQTAIFNEKWHLNSWP